MPESWADKLKEVMRNEHIIYDDVAAELGVGKSYISLVLSGRRRPANGRERLEGAVDRIIERKRKRMSEQRDLEWEIAKRNRLKEEYGGLLNLSQVQRELGCQSPRGAKVWLGDMPYTEVGSQRKWFIEDIAQKLCSERILPY